MLFFVIEKTPALLLTVWQLAISHMPLPRDLVNPSRDPLTEEGIAFHQTCLRLLAA